MYLPKPGVNKPALLIELKYDKSAQSAITQIKEKNYLQFFKDYKGEVLGSSAKVLLPKNR